MGNDLPYDGDEYYREGDYDPLNETEHETIDILLAVRKHLQSKLEEFLMEETRENDMNLADQVVVVATDADFALARTQLNSDNAPYIAYGLFRAVLAYLQSVYECTDGDLEETIGAFWEQYYIEGPEEAAE